MKKLQLTDGSFCLVDDFDYDLYWRMSWRKCNGYPASRDAYGNTVYLHRLIAVPSAGYEVDHIDGDKLNAQRNNLRQVTSAQNKQNAKKKSNTSGYIGVCYEARRGNWNARIRVAGSRLSLGAFTSAELAAQAYDKAAKEHYGPEAKVNFQ